MQTFTSIKAARTLTDSREPLLDNDLTIMSCSSGDVFPTVYIVIGMFCYRTDQKKLYQLRGNNDWVLIFDLTKSSVSQEYVDVNFATKNGVYDDLRAKATTKADVGLSNIPNKISSDSNLDDAYSLATSKAINTVNDMAVALELKVDKNIVATNGKAALRGSTSVDFNCKGLKASSSIVASGDVTAFSDVRLKRDVKTISDALWKIKGLRGVTFTRINDGVQCVGLVAQEVQTVMPEAVRQHDGLLSVAYGSLVGLLIEGIKSLDARLSKLEK